MTPQELIERRKAGHWDRCVAWNKNDTGQCMRRATETVLGEAFCAQHARRAYKSDKYRAYMVRVEGIKQLGDREERMVRNIAARFPWYEGHPGIYWVAYQLADEGFDADMVCRAAS